MFFSNLEDNKIIVFYVAYNMSPVALFAIANAKLLGFNWLQAIYESNGQKRTSSRVPILQYTI